MSYGPVRVDFTPLGQIGNSFFNARDQAIDRQFKMAQLTAPSRWAQIQAENMGQGQDGTQPPANVQPGQPGMVPLGSIGQAKPPTFAGQPTQAASILKGFEGYSDKPYWDVNAYRIGYGSDTITDPATGQVRKVTPNDHIDQAAADADLMRRIPEFQRTAFQQTNAFGSLPQPVQAALTSVAYNYGSLPKTVVAAVNSGDLNQIASAVEALPANPGRRKQEAAIIRSAGTQTAQATPSLPTMAGGQGSPSMTMPAGTGTVPLANPFQTSDAPPQDLPVAGTKEVQNQFVIPGSDQSQAQAQAPAPARVVAPRIPIPAYVIQGLKDPNVFVQQKALELYQQYQTIQRQYDEKAWEINSRWGLEGPVKQGTMEAQRERAAAATSSAQTQAARLKFDQEQPISAAPNTTLFDRGTLTPKATAPAAPTPDQVNYQAYIKQLPPGAQPKTLEQFIADQKAGGSPDEVAAREGLKAEATAEGTKAADRGNDLMSAAAAATERLNRINLLKNILAHTQTGPGAATAGKIGEYALQAGISPETLQKWGIDPNQAVNNQMAQKLSAELVSESIGAKNGGFPASNFNLAERQFIESKFANIKNQPGANEAVSDVLAAKEQRILDKAQAWDDYASKAEQQGKRPIFSQFERQWLRDHGNDNIFAPIEKKFEAGGYGPAGAEAPAVNTRSNDTATAPTDTTQPTGNNVKRPPIKTSLPIKIPKNMTVEEAMKKFPPGTEVVLPDGRIGTVPQPQKMDPYNG